MISYKPFFDTLLRKNVTEYELIFKHGVSANTIHRMKKGEAITTKTLDVLCYILDCPVSDIIEHDNTKYTRQEPTPLSIFFIKIIQKLYLNSFPSPLFLAFLTLHAKFCVFFSETVIIVSCYNDVVKHMNPHNFTGSHQSLRHINVLR